jgi:hypothetical protein
VTVTGAYTASSANTTLFQLIRTFESGSPAGDYSLNPGNGAYGAYQMRAPALQDAGAIKSASVSLTDPTNWTGTYGKSLDDFLGTPSNQDGAAAAYLDKYVVPALDRTGALYTVGTSFTDSKGNTEWITQDGLLLAAWNIPGAAAGTVNVTAGAPQPGTAQYTDTLSRFQAGALADGLTVTDPTARAIANSQAVIKNGSVVVSAAAVTNALQNGQSLTGNLNGTNISVDTNSSGTPTLTADDGIETITVTDAKMSTWDKIVYDVENGLTAAEDWISTTASSVGHTVGGFLSDVGNALLPSASAAEATISLTSDNPAGGANDNAPVGNVNDNATVNATASTNGGTPNFTALATFSGSGGDGTTLTMLSPLSPL